MYYEEIKRIMDNYRATKKISQADFNIPKKSGIFNDNELCNIMLGLPIGQQ